MTMIRTPQESVLRLETDPLGNSRRQALYIQKVLSSFSLVFSLPPLANSWNARKSSPFPTSSTALALLQPLLLSISISTSKPLLHLLLRQTQSQNPTPHSLQPTNPIPKTLPLKPYNPSTTLHSSSAPSISPPPSIIRIPRTRSLAAITTTTTTASPSPTDHPPSAAPFSIQTSASSSVRRFAFFPGISSPLDLTVDCWRSSDGKLQNRRLGLTSLSGIVIRRRCC